jgi:plasmid stabilization system protein ParE
MLILRSEAEQDIKEAYEWYERQRENLGRAFVSEVESKLETIEDNPDLYAKVYQNVRRALCRRFPHSIYFFKAGKDVVIIGVLHQRRSPSAWQARK